MTARLTTSEVSALLERTSRTFALAIPLLPEHVASDVGLAYLLFRIADTLEDADLWDRATRHEALLSFSSWLDGGDRRFLDLARQKAPSSNADYGALVLRADAVRASLDESAAPIVVRHVRRTAQGMAEFVAQQDARGGIALPDLAALRAYCYAVAGIVGELLTDLFVHRDAACARVEDALRAEAASFGEGLQLVNILKDAPDDAREGRTYVPQDIPRADVFDLARRDLESARRYVRVLEDAGAARGIVAFCILPQRLADATLDRLALGEKKLARDEAMKIFAEVTSRTS